MKQTLISILIVFSICQVLPAQTKELIELRNLSAKSTEEAVEQMIFLLNKQASEDPVINGYRSIAMLLHSKNSYSPFDKIKYFKNGKKLLEESVGADVTSVELRYLRFCVQTNVPFFLNYTSDIEEDKRIILQNWSKLTDTDLKERIRLFMMRSEFCNDIEKRTFGNG